MHLIRNKQLLNTGHQLQSTEQYVSVAPICQYVLLVYSITQLVGAGPQTIACC